MWFENENERRVGKKPGGVERRGKHEAVDFKRATKIDLSKSNLVSVVARKEGERTRSVRRPRVGEESTKSRNGGWEENWLTGSKGDGQRRIALLRVVTFFFLPPAASGCQWTAARQYKIKVPSSSQELVPRQIRHRHRHMYRYLYGHSSGTGT